MCCAMHGIYHAYEPPVKQKGLSSPALHPPLKSSLGDPESAAGKSTHERERVRTTIEPARRHTEPRGRVRNREEAVWYRCGGHSRCRGGSIHAPELLEDAVEHCGDRGMRLHALGLGRTALQHTQELAKRHRGLSRHGERAELPSRECSLSPSARTIRRPPSTPPSAPPASRPAIRPTTRPTFLPTFLRSDCHSDRESDCRLEWYSGC